MTATEEIRKTAELFGWDHHVTPDQHDVLIRGDQMVDVLYSANGSVTSAQLYWFFSLQNLQLRERARDKHKKATVLAWLVS